MSMIQIVGRRGSHFTRMVRMVAHEVDVKYELVPIYDMRQLEAGAYADNPALKLPILRRGDASLFGALNICRTLAELVGATAQIEWPEDRSDDLARNAQELVWHAMAAQVQLIVGTVIGKLPADNIYFVKTRTGLEGSLRWLDANLAKVLATRRADPRLSIFEVSMFCLIEHVRWRETAAIDRCARLTAWASDYATRPSALATVYEADTPPGSGN
jgi:glutathione S-transferase